MTKSYLAFAAAIVLGTLQPVAAQNLVPNGDFEDIQVVDDVPSLDDYGLEQPVAWFRSITDPNTVPNPGTELISPNNMNNAAGNSLGDDSNGVGTNSIALNYVPDESNPPLGIGMDWRSEGFETTPGEPLIVSFDVKFIGVSQGEVLPGSGFYEGGLAQFRSFTGQAPDGGTAGTFQGELNIGFKAHNFSPNAWHTIKGSLVVPDGGAWTDVRISSNLFTPPFHTGGQILLDNVVVQRLTADFDDDKDVDATDLGLWTAAFGLTDVGDADGDGLTDGNDVLAWQQQLGLKHPMASPAVGAIPEPATSALAVIAALAFGRARPRRARRRTSLLER